MKVGGKVLHGPRCHPEDLPGFPHLRLQALLPLLSLRRRIRLLPVARQPHAPTSSYDAVVVQGVESQSGQIERELDAYFTSETASTCSASTPSVTFVSSAMTLFK